METIPLFSEELIEMLDRMFPVPQFAPGHSMDDIMYMSGRRAIVDMLIAKLEYTRRLEKEKSINVHG